MGFQNKAVKVKPDTGGGSGEQEHVSVELLGRTKRRELQLPRRPVSINLANNLRLKMLEAENQELKSRLSVLTRSLISKEVFTAAEIAAFIVEVDSEAKAQLMTEPATCTSIE